MLTEGKVRVIAASVAAAFMKKGYEPAATDLPRIFFTGHFPSSKLESDGSAVMEYISKTKRFKAYVSVKVQGSSSTTFKKKNYTFRLYEDATHAKKKKVAFRNWPAKNKFVAKANTIDRTHARNVVSARIWGDMARCRAGYNDLPDELKNSPNMGAIDGFPVKIYLNGVYQGLYTWNFGKEDWMAGLDEDNANHIMVCAEGNGTVPKITFNEAYTDKTAIFNGYDWEVEVGKVNDTIQTNYKAFHDLVVIGTDEEFRANLSTYLNIESFIDTYIFMWLVCGVDSLGKNQFMYTYNAGLPWFSGVYDLDSTWGMHPDAARFFPHDTVMPDGYITTNNRLYARFWSLFQDRIRARWNEVKHSALSLANIINHFEAFNDAIPADLFAEDSAATTANGAFVTSTDSKNKGFDVVPGVDKSNIQQIRNFAAARWAYVDAQINYIECDGISLSETSLTVTKEQGQAILTAILTPDGCNEPVEWNSSDTGVAEVSNGTVTAICNGNCTITATCGAFSASCDVTVEGFEDGEVANSNLILNSDGSYKWKIGYEGSSSGEVNKGNTFVALTDKFPFKVGDRFVITGAQVKYSTSGYSSHPIYNSDGDLVGSLASNRTGATISVSGQVSTVTISEDWLNAEAQYALSQTNKDDLIANGGYIRFTLKVGERDDDISDNTIEILRNP